MIWARGCIHCKEDPALCASAVVGAWDVDSLVDDVIYVLLCISRGSMGMSTINSKPCPKGNDQALIWCGEVIGVPAIVVEDCVC